MQIIPFLKSASSILVHVRKNSLLKLCVFIVILSFAVLTGSIIFISVSKKTVYCNISLNNFCDGKYIEITGFVTNPTMYSGLGYEFIPDNKTVQNKIYISNIRFSGKNLARLEDYFYFNIPFGTKIKVKGRVLVNDMYRCTQTDYATENKNICSQKNFRIVISPVSVISVSAQFSNFRTFSVDAKIQEIERVVKECPNTIHFCESIEANPSCYSIDLGKPRCEDMKIYPNIFFISGNLEEGKNHVYYGDIVQVTSVDYSSTPVDPVGTAQIKKYNTGSKTTTVVAYDKDATELFRTSIDDNLYSDASMTMPVKNGVYFFYNGKLYFQKKDEKLPVLAGEIDKKYVNDMGSVSNIKISPDGSYILFQTSIPSSDRTVGYYGIITFHEYFHKLDLSKLSSDTKILPTEILYEEEMEGNMYFSAFNFSNGEALFSYSLTSENPQNCRNRYYFTYNTRTKQKRDVFSHVSDGNKNCLSPIYRNLFTSTDGKYLVFGKDFNDANPGIVENKLLVVTVTSSGVTKKEYLSEQLVIKNENIQIVGVRNNNLIIINPAVLDIAFQFGLAYNIFRWENIRPLYTYKTLGKSEIKIWQILNPRYVHEDSRNWYFMSRDVLENKYYIVNKITRDTFLAGTFSVFARPIIYGNNFYIVDLLR